MLQLTYGKKQEYSKLVTVLLLVPAVSQSIPFPSDDSAALQQIRGPENTEMSLVWI